MLSRLLTWLVAVPFGAVVVALSVTNRKPVTVALEYCGTRITWKRRWPCTELALACV